MGTLVRHGEGQGAVWTYTPLGTPQAYGKLDTASLLLLAVQASRLVCRAPSSGVRAAWRLVLDVARGRRQFGRVARRSTRGRNEAATEPRGVATGLPGEQHAVPI